MVSPNKSYCLPDFAEQLKIHRQYPLKSCAVEILQINVGRQCNLTCRHCHLQSGPLRTEMMPASVFHACLEAARQTPGLAVVDVTGGSPEMNPNLEWFLPAAAELHKRLLVRTNLAILLEPPYQKYIALYAACGTEVVGSLPDYRREKTDCQRGAGNFLKAVEALKLLNARGFGRPGSGLVLDLMHNPVGACLPGAQAELEHEYRVHLASEFGITFNRLFTLANMPLGRHREYLIQTDNYAGYVRDLVGKFNACSVPQLMCRNTLSVGWDGKLYDCDFNQSLDRPILSPEAGHIARYDPRKLAEREIAVGDHCFGCTAGAGSSCQGGCV